MKKYIDPEIDLIAFDIEDRTNEGFGNGDNDFPIDNFSEPGTKWNFGW